MSGQLRVLPSCCQTNPKPEAAGESVPPDVHRETKHNLPHDGDRSPAESGDKSPHSKAAFSLIELLVVICVLGLLMFVLVPRMMQAKQKVKRIRCVSRVNIIGLSSRLWSSDHADQYPFALSVTNGGTLEFSNQVWRSFQVMSNELGTPVILACPADTRRPSTNFATLGNSNISYFIGLDADESNPQHLLAGDRHLTNGRATTNKVLTLRTNDIVGWTGANHQGQGNIALADGSVQQLSSARLQQSVIVAGTNATLRLAMPE